MITAVSGAHSRRRGRRAMRQIEHFDFWFDPAPPCSCHAPRGGGAGASSSWERRSLMASTRRGDTTPTSVRR